MVQAAQASSRRQPNSATTHHQNHADHCQASRRHNPRSTRTSAPDSRRRAELSRANPVVCANRSPCSTSARPLPCPPLPDTPRTSPAATTPQATASIHDFAGSLPNTRIPTESELVETYEVARSTARRAVKALRDEGLVYTVPQRGTYVAEQFSATQENP
jgi:Bacterial regulatory proteins, gntR family